MSKKGILFLIVFTLIECVSPIFFSALGSNSSSLASCKKKELDNKNCDLKLNPYQLHFTEKRVTIEREFLKRVQDLPLLTDGLVWKKISLSAYGTRWIVEFELLTPASGEIRLQDLHWIVMELKMDRGLVLLDEIIQKQRSHEDTQQKKQTENRLKTGLKVDKNNKIRWWAGAKEGFW